jgi:hypothetical protein
MKIRPNVAVYTGLCAFATVWLGAADLRSAPGENSPAAPRGAGTTALPQSVFVVPANRAEGRDPFFPNSTRGGAVIPTPQPTVTNVGLVLNGLSGTPENRLAIVNGRTLAKGESSEVNVAGRRVLIRCIEIREKSAVVEAGGSRQELFLRD